MESFESRPVLGIDVGCSKSRITMIQNIEFSGPTVESQEEFRFFNGILLNESEEKFVSSAYLPLMCARYAIGRTIDSKSLQKYIQSFPCEIKQISETDKRLQIKFGNMNLYPEHIIGTIIKKLVRQINQDQERKCNIAVLTYPGCFYEYQRGSMLATVRIAGVNIIDAITNAKAISVYYRYEYNKNTSEEQKEKVMIIDIGGMTTDISVIEINGNEFRTLAMVGNDNLGGICLDSELIEYVNKEMKEKHGIDIVSGEFEEREMYRMKTEIMRECEKSKLAMKKEGDKYCIQIRIPNPRQDKETDSEYKTYEVVVSYELLHKIFNEKMKGEIEKLICELKSIYKQSYRENVEVDNLIFSGGLFNLPFVNNTIKELISIECDAIKIDDSLRAASRGAAIYGFLKMNKIQEIENLEVIPYSFGIGVVSKKEKKVLRFVQKNAPVPIISKPFHFRGIRDAKVVKMSVFEGDSDFQEENNLLEEVTAHDLPFDEDNRPVFDLFIERSNFKTLTIYKSPLGSLAINVERTWYHLTDDEIKKITRDVNKWTCLEESDKDSTPAGKFKKWLNGAARRELMMRFSTRPSVYAKIDKIVRKYRVWANEHEEATTEDIRTIKERMFDKVKAEYHKK